MFLIIIKKYSWLLIIFSFIFWFTYIKKEPCETPIMYRVGSFDNRFNIKEKDFLDALNVSVKIWENSINKNLFEYNPKGNLVVNLIYDERQQTTQENEILKTDISKINQLAKSTKDEYIILQNNSDILRDEYQKEINLYEQHQSEYNSQVDYWNNKGGAPLKEYNALVIKKQVLNLELDALENKRLELNAEIAKTNAFINKYNLLVDTVNVNIEAVNKTAGKEFEEGVYDPNKNEINIYEFSSKQKLIRVLTHELGHSLGLPHNDNPEGIMYSLNSSNSLELSKEDLLDLKAKCNLN